MEHPPSFSEVLRKYLDRSLYTPGQLYKLTGISKETIANWIDGIVKKPRGWRDLLKIAKALHLSEPEVNELLEAAQQPSIAELLARVDNEKDRDLLAPWDTEERQRQRALRQFAALPLHILPDLAPLPPGSRMPLSHNPLFVGRLNDLLAVARAIKGGESVSVVQSEITAASGMGGIGKTQLASEFVHHYGQFFAGGVFWLSFADAEAVPVEIAACGGAGFMELRPDFSALSLNEQVRLVRAGWQSPLPRLLVFDNCEDESLLEQWRPTTGGCRLLVTSRRVQWDAALGVRALPLDVLRREESIALLCKHRPDLLASDDELDAIAAEVGDLPLALHLAGKYLARYRHTVTTRDYLVQLRGPAPLNHPSFQGSGLSPTKHHQHVAGALALSYEQLDVTQPIAATALHLLARAAYFAPGELIPSDLLAATLGTSSKFSEAMTLIEDALTRLVELGLLEMAHDQALRLHRLIAAYVRERSHPADAQGDVERALLEIAIRLNDMSDVLPMMALQRHLRHVTDAALARQDAIAGNLCEAMGHHLWMIQDYSGAHTYLEQALATRERSRTCEPLKIAASYNLLALLAQSEGDLEQARNLFEQALAIWQVHLGPNHETTATEHHNLGYVFLMQGDFDQAQKHLRHALIVRKRRYHLFHIDTARSLNHLGYLSFKQGQYRAARRYLKLALKIREKVLPPINPGTAQTLDFLGQVAHMQADYDAAWGYHERALTMRQALFGEIHRDTAESYYNLGRVLHMQGDYVKSQSHLEQARSINMPILGPNNYDTAVILHSLGCLLRDLGEYTEAQAYLEQALSSWEQQVGLDYPEAATTIHHLGLLFEAQGDEKRTHDYIERALAIRMARLGADHPDVAESFNDFGSLLNKQGDNVRAQHCFEHALAICKQRLGPGHPLTLKVQANLVMLA